MRKMTFFIIIYIWILMTNNLKKINTLQYWGPSLDLDQTWTRPRVQVQYWSRSRSRVCWTWTWGLGLGYTVLGPGQSPTLYAYISIKFHSNQNCSGKDFYFYFLRWFTRVILIWMNFDWDIHVQGQALTWPLDSVVRGPQKVAGPNLDWTWTV